MADDVDGAGDWVDGARDDVTESMSELLSLFFKGSSETARTLTPNAVSLVDGMNNTVDPSACLIETLSGLETG